MAIWMAMVVVFLVVRGAQKGFDLRALFGSPAARGTVEELYEARRSNVFVEIEGIVSRTLSDDREGSRHQRFIVELASGHTVLVSHNIDLAERVPLRPGDQVAVRGEYEWNDRGGVVHWTHHDPQGRRPGGWIVHEGVDYR
jgi:translation initiation factor IF-1